MNNQAPLDIKQFEKDQKRLRVIGVCPTCLKAVRFKEILAGGVPSLSVRDDSGNTYHWPCYPSTINP